MTTTDKDARRAYDAGWRASERMTYDLDEAERRFCKRWPNPSGLFSDGWLDCAAEKPKGWTLRERGIK
jgi:hypothetical protein